jgi:Mrp family chromosome partitioning ATPase
LGLVLGVALAFFAEAIDTRVADADEIAERVEQPLLARIPPSRRTRERGLAMIDDPGGPEAEAFRMLRTNLELANLDVRARVILVTSSVPREGKTTTAANLALALAARGRRVILCDLDSRNPQLASLFGLKEAPGIVDVTLRRVGLDEALISVPIPSAVGFESLQKLPSPFDTPSNGDEPADAQGRIDVLAFGKLVPDPGEFVGTQAVADLLAELRERADLVIVDAAPLLHVADALTLSTRVDAILVVARISVVRRPMLEELRRVLDRVGTPTLGFVAIGCPESTSHYGYGPHLFGPPRSSAAGAAWTRPTGVRLSADGDD